MNVKINIAQLRYLLDNIPDDQNIMLEGRHGIGKSEILTDYFSKSGMSVIPLFLGQMSDPGDLIGLPHKDEKTGKTEFMPPYWFPVDGKPIVLFLDELNRARPEVLQTIMDLALNRKLAGKRLPEGSRIIAAVNEGEEYQLTDLDPALVSRFNIFRFEPSVDEWIAWAQNNGLDSRVIEFIRDNGTWLDQDPTLSEGEDTGLDKTPDRRAWKRVSDVIRDKRYLEKNDHLLLSGIVGVKAVNKFLKHIRRNERVLAADLLNDFDSVVNSLDKMKPHEYNELNESVYEYIQSRCTVFPDPGRIVANLRRYVDYMKEHNRKEAMATFRPYYIDRKYSAATRFITRMDKSILDDIRRDIESIRL